MPKVELTDIELEIVSHALELYLQRYQKSRDHWRWFARKHSAVGAVTRLQHTYDGLEEVFESFVRVADSLVRRLDSLIKASSGKRVPPSPPPTRVQTASIESSRPARRESKIVVNKAGDTMRIKKR